LKDADVVRAFEAGGIGAAAEVHRAAKFVDVRVAVLAHPRLQAVQQRGEDARAVFQQHGDELIKIQLDRVGPGGGEFCA
jgi:hypothetical protein